MRQRGQRDWGGTAEGVGADGPRRQGLRRHQHRPLGSLAPRRSTRLFPLLLHHELLSILQLYHDLSDPLALLRLRSLLTFPWSQCWSYEGLSSLFSSPPLIS